MAPERYSRPRHMSGGDPLAGRSLCGRARQWGGRSGAPQRGTEPSGATQTSRPFRDDGDECKHLRTFPTKTCRWLHCDVSIYALFLEKRVNGYMEMPGQAGHDDLDAGHADFEAWHNVRLIDPSLRSG